MTLPYRVAMVGGRPAPIAGARELGIDVVLVHEEGSYDPGILRHCERVVHAPVNDGPAILDVLRPLHEERPFDRVLTTSEPAGVAVGHVVTALGLPGVGEETARVLKDKRLTRERLAEHGLSPVRHRLLHSPQDAADFFTGLGTGRAVVKPVDGAASRNILLVSSAHEASLAYKTIEQAGGSAALGEEYLEGPVVAADTFSLGGRHVVLGFSEYRINERFVEWEVSAPSRIAAPHEAELRELTERLLDAVGLTEGPSYSEFVLTADGPRVLESHARLGGCGAPELARRAFGLDPARMLLTVPLGIDPLPEASPAPVGGAALRYLTPRPGTVTSVAVAPGLPAEVRRVPEGVTNDLYLPFFDELKRHETGAAIALNPGEQVPELLTLAHASAGYVISSGRDADEAVDRCARVAEGIRIETDGVTAP
ncbi:argininosuccinate lyase [Streptomyces viridochromogenes DSM 40736]|uniref:Argininosuccinate lyase n=1 Tax=Streptomyces viridochromogenes (strain DSM 40736 / JCM 4977 / BCRC 1201 / Tue 494) TaxID=591159 RepID=D9X6T8_STRVT|nr:ATP-grasp domain-containing protein [Streptomyces viridochromogenes]EFL34005.1 argininosuccinate lyase [Streptomyces viridochromogenes DSM 40736]